HVRNVGRREGAQHACFALIGNSKDGVRSTNPDVAHVVDLVCGCVCVCACVCACAVSARCAKAHKCKARKNKNAHTYSLRVASYWPCALEKGPFSRLSNCSKVALLPEVFKV